METDQVTTAVLLAAGTGSRLQPLTNDSPKCLSEVSGIPILERLVGCLRGHGFKRLVVVVGYLEHQVREFLDKWKDDLVIEYIINPRYSNTNNLYSLWLARASIDGPFLLCESDVVFDAALLDNLLWPDRIATSRMQEWMHGTTVSIDLLDQVIAFHTGDTSVASEVRHKTVNMYSLTLASWHRVSERLCEHVTAGGVNEYYETVFAEMIADGSLSLEAVDFDCGSWYEIDTLEDLHEAEKLFPVSTLEESCRQRDTSQP
jgi:choline kinase